MPRFGLALDLVVNYAGLAVAASAGVLLNILIVQLSGIEELGVFNLSYAIFVLLSQITVFGVHLSCLRQCALNPVNYAKILSAGLIVVAVIASFTSLLFFLLSPVLTFLNVEGVVDGAGYICLALVCFSLNKVFAFTLNGMSRMRLYAAVTVARATLLLIFVALLAYSEASLPLVSAFLFAEALLLLLFCALFFRSVAAVMLTRDVRSEIGLHLDYGRKVVVTGVSLELNARVDVLVLGVFLSSVSVGLYSFVAMLVEGFYQLIVVVKNVINPRLAKYYAEGNRSKLESFILRVVLSMTAAFSVVAVIAVYLYPILIDFLGLDQALKEAFPVFSILIGFMAVLSGWMCLDQVLAVCGQPKLSSKLYLFSVLLNLVMNCMLIPVWGLLGAALATGISWLVFVFMLNVASMKYLKVSLLPICNKK